MFNMSQGVTTVNGFNNAGTLAVAAGTTAGTTGNDTQAASGFFDTALVSASNYGKLAVSGVANFSAGNKIRVNVGGGPVLLVGTSVQPGVISAGTLTAANGSVVSDTSALFDFIATKNVNTVDLCVTTAGAVNSDANPDTYGLVAGADTIASPRVRLAAAVS